MTRLRLRTWLHRLEMTSVNVFSATEYVISRTTASEAAVRSAAGFAGPEAIVDVVAS